MISFTDRNRETYFFSEYPFMWGDGHASPPHVPGCYMIVDRNREDRDGAGTHTVLYVGQSKDVCNRMVDHCRYHARFDEIGRWRGGRMYDYLVLHAREEQTDAHFRDWEYDRFPNPLERLEQRLKFLFVPATRCFEHAGAAAAGFRFGNTNQVVLDHRAEELRWA